MLKKIKYITMYFSIILLSYGRNVYIVYDDSKSMLKDNRDVYANYSVQTLVSLLESDDNLVLVKMSDINSNFRTKTTLNLKSIPKELNYLRQNLIAKSNLTPYDAVYSTLEEIDKEKGKNDDNWLIVITDGEFEDGKPIKNIEEIKGRLPEIVKDTKLKPIFLLIGSNKDELEKYEKQEGIQIWKDTYGEGVYPKIYKAIGKKEITEKMEEIAQLLTGKSSELSKEDYEIHENKINFNSKFPIRKLVYLNLEDKGNEILSIDVDGKKIQINKIYEPTISFKNKEHLKGQIIHLEGENNGHLGNEIKITFKNQVKKVGKFYPEVGAKFQLELLQDNKKTISDSIVDLPSKENIKFIGKLLIEGKPMEYVKGTNIVVTYGSKEIPLKYNLKDGYYYGQTEVEKGKKSIDARAEYPGYFYYQSDIYIINGIKEKIVEPIKPIEPPKAKAIEAPKIIVIPDKYSLETNLKNNKFYTQKEIKDFNLEIKPLKNGKELSEEELKKLTLDIKSELELEKINKNFKGWVYKIKTYENFGSRNNPQGQYEININLKDTNNSSIENGNVSLKLDIEKFSVGQIWLKYILKTLKIIGFILGTIFLIYGYINKKRFNSKSKIYIKEIGEDDFSHRPERQFKLKTNFLNRIAPFISQVKELERIKFVAKTKESISIQSDNLYKIFSGNVSKIYIGGTSYNKEEIKNNKDYTLYNGDSLEILYDEGNHKYTKKYTYKIDK